MHRNRSTETNRRSFATRAISFADRQFGRLIWGRTFGEFGKKSEIGRPLFLSGRKSIFIQKSVKIWKMARLEAIGPEGQIKIGQGTIIQPFVHIGAAKLVEIGNNCLFASQVYISDHDHDWIDPDVPPALSKKLICAPVSIGDGVWLGERVVVLKGVSIGENSVVGAGSVVTKSLPSRCVAVGIPAKIVNSWNAKTGRWEKV
jgi:acetyltransferase-like isoleucine patch superfamily enzyme